MERETLITPAGYNIAAYSVNGGKSWKKGALPTGDKFNKLFNKDLTLWLAATLDAKKKPIGEFVKFPKINARPKGNTEKLKPFYLSETWELRTRAGGAAKLQYEWADTTDRRTPSSAWQSAPAGGFAVQSGRTKKTVLFRTPATANGNTYTPAGRVFRVTPANFGKAPNYQYNDKKDAINLRSGDMYQIGSATPQKAAGPLANVSSLNADKITAWRAETGRKPRSEKKEVALG